MEPNLKIKMTKQEFEEFYEITEEIVDIPDEDIPDKQNTTPEFLTDEEEAFDIAMHDQEPQEDKQDAS